LLFKKKGQELEPDNSNFKTWIRKCKAELENEVSTIPQKGENIVTPKEKTIALPKETITSRDQPLINQNVAPIPEIAKIRHEWYQTQSHVFVTIFVKNVKQEHATIDFQTKSLNVTIKLSPTNEYQLNVDLCGDIVPEESTTSFLSTKLEIKLKKESFIRWKTLEDVGESIKVIDPVIPPVPSSSSSTVKPKKNWDKIVEEETKGEKLEGEESLNKVFQDIYSNATDEQKKAMMKSYMESGGTVLSTNWDEVGKGEVKGSPPDGMEMKKWNDLNK